MPKRIKFRKQQRGTLKGKATRGNFVAFGEFGLQALETEWVTARQIEAGRVAATHYLRRQGKVYIRIFPDKPISEVHKLSDEELVIEVKRLRQRLFELRTQAVTEKIQDTSQFRKTRTDIARLLTEQQARVAAVAAEIASKK
jgi:ribosomal protein L16